MLDNYNFQSDEKIRIIRLFDEYSKDESLRIWESFNAFYNCLHRNNSLSAKIREHEKIENISKGYQKAFEEWINKERPDEILSFYNLMENRTHPWFAFLRNGGVISINQLERNKMEWRPPTNGHAVQYYSNITNLKEFLFSIYTIRCNKVHWDKNPTNDSDIEILKKGSVALREFLEFLYTI